LEASDPANLKSRGNYHINAKTFKDKVNQAIQGAFPKSDNFRYAAVHVLLLRWEEHDLDPPCSAEVKRLRHVFEEDTELQSRNGRSHLAVAHMDYVVTH
jgi:hypothetical protein